MIRVRAPRDVFQEVSDQQFAPAQESGDLELAGRLGDGPFTVDEDAPRVRVSGEDRGQ